MRCGDLKIWTVLQNDGPNHLGLRCNALPAHQMARITSGCVPFRRPSCTRRRSGVGPTLQSGTAARLAARELIPPCLRFGPHAGSGGSRKRSRCSRRGPSPRTWCGPRLQPQGAITAHLLPPLTGVSVSACLCVCVSPCLRVCVSWATQLEAAGRLVAGVRQAAEPPVETASVGVETDHRQQEQDAAAAAAALGRVAAQDAEDKQARLELIDRSKREAEEATAAAARCARERAARDVEDRARDEGWTTRPSEFHTALPPNCSTRRSLDSLFDPVLSCDAVLQRCLLLCEGP